MNKAQTKVILGSLAVAGAAVVGYFALLRPRHLRWGTQNSEAVEPLPGDRLISDVGPVATHAVTIEASPAEIWPWLVQIGQNKGGFYSYSVLENLLGGDIHNAREIHSEWQALKPGDVVKFHPTHPAVPVVEVVENSHLVLAADMFGPGATTWVFVIRDLGHNRSRLIARLRQRRHAGIKKVADLLVVEPAHFVMERKMLLTIKRLAESQVSADEAAA